LAGRDGMVQAHIEEAGHFEKSAAGSLLRSGDVPTAGARAVK
jgi:hypothetical protein